MAWLTTSKIARKAGHVQTAYSAILQAMSLHAPFTFVQQAKLMRANGQPLKALSELENILPTLRTDPAVVGLSGHPLPLDGDPVQGRENIALAKVSICQELTQCTRSKLVPRLSHFQPGGLSRLKGSTPTISSSVSRRQSNLRQSQCEKASQRVE